MYLCEARVGGNYTVEKINLPFETERRLEALGMTGKGAVTRSEPQGQGHTHHKAARHALRPWL